MTPHIHHWRIPEPNGQAARATCKGCSAERVFQNVFIGDREAASLHRYRKTKNGEGLVLR